MTTRLRWSHAASLLLLALCACKDLGTLTVPPQQDPRPPEDTAGPGGSGGPGGAGGPGAPNADSGAGGGSGVTASAKGRLNGLDDCDTTTRYRDNDGGPTTLISANADNATNADPTVFFWARSDSGVTLTIENRVPPGKVLVVADGETGAALWQIPPGEHDVAIGRARKGQDAVSGRFGKVVRTLTPAAGDADSTQTTEAGLQTGESLLLTQLPQLEGRKRQRLTVDLGGQTLAFILWTQ